MAQSVSRDNLGAWLVKSDPRVWDLPQAVADGVDRILSWTVQDNYRSHLMREHDRVLFWVSGRHPEFPRGIWGAGYLTGEASDSVEGSDNRGYWLDNVARLRVSYEAPMDVPLRLDAPVTDAELRLAGIHDLEVQRMPGSSNPSWVDKAQLVRLNALLGRWPARPSSVADITVTERGAGYGDPLQNKAVEDAAMIAVADRYRNEGWKVKDVSRAKVGWDLTCTRGKSTAKVEVKGVSGSRTNVLLTANELLKARSEADWVLAVVVLALRESRRVLVFDRNEVVAAASPYVYRADFDSVK